MRILVVEDDRTIRSFVEQDFKKAGFFWFPNSSFGTMNRKLLLPLYSYNVTCSKSIFSLL